MLFLATNEVDFPQFYVPPEMALQVGSPWASARYPMLGSLWLVVLFLSMLVKKAAPGTSIRQPGVFACKKNRMKPQTQAVPPEVQSPVGDKELFAQSQIRPVPSTERSLAAQGSVAWKQWAVTAQRAETHGGAGVTRTCKDTQSVNHVLHQAAW